MAHRASVAVTNENASTYAHIFWACCCVCVRVLRLFCSRLLFLCVVVHTLLFPLFTPPPYLFLVDSSDLPQSPGSCSFPHFFFFSQYFFPALLPVSPALGPVTFQCCVSHSSSATRLAFLLLHTHGATVQLPDHRCVPSAPGNCCCTRTDRVMQGSYTP